MAFYQPCPASKALITLTNLAFKKPKELILKLAIILQKLVRRTRIDSLKNLRRRQWE